MMEVEKVVECPSVAVNVCTRTESGTRVSAKCADICAETAAIGFQAKQYLTPRNFQLGRAHMCDKKPQILSARNLQLLGRIELSSITALFG
jgi:hypothetical protein